MVLGKVESGVHKHRRWQKERDGKCRAELKWQAKQEKIKTIVMWLDTCDSSLVRNFFVVTTTATRPPSLPYVRSTAVFRVSPWLTATWPSSNPCILCPALPILIVYCLDGFSLHVSIVYGGSLEARRKYLHLFKSSERANTTSCGARSCLLAAPNSGRCTLTSQASQVIHFESSKWISLPSWYAFNCHFTHPSFFSLSRCTQQNFEAVCPLQSSPVSILITEHWQLHIHTHWPYVHPQHQSQY
jgi:hypothetical protein